MTDLRTAHWAEIRAKVADNREAVWRALLDGPATGSELAARMGWSVLSVRPRLTELSQLRFAVATSERRNSEHVFRALTEAEARANHDAARSEPGQLQLAMA